MRSISCWAALTELARRGEYNADALPAAITDLGLNPDAPDPATA